MRGDHDGHQVRVRAGSMSSTGMSSGIAAIAKQPGLPSTGCIRLRFVEAARFVPHQVIFSLDGVNAKTDVTCT
jgi:hypothetical protein